MKGVDLSVHNGDVDIELLKSQGVEFVVLRAGYGKFVKQKDAKFERNYLNAKRAGLHVGAYWYSYAKDAVEALAEAKACEEILGGKQFDLPIFLDIEEACSAKNAQDILDAFAAYMQSKGYYVGVYSNKSYFANYMSLAPARYPAWVAQWASKCTYNGPMIMWQNSDKGRYNGVNGYVDTDILYNDDIPCYIMEHGFNNYPKEEPPKTKKLEIFLGGEKIFEKDL